MSLHQLMATAVELEPGYKNRFGNTDGNRGYSNQKGITGKRGGKKIDCPKCHKTHWDDEKCPSWGKPGNKNDTRGKGPRVSEGEV